MTSEPQPASRLEQLEVARRIALKQLESRQRTEEELRRALAKRNTPEDVIDELMTRFKDVRLVDDHAFAVALATTRVSVQRRGAARIRQELREKGVPQDIAEEAIRGIDAQDEYDAALTFALKRASTMRTLEHLVAKRRLYGALARRGFSADVVRRAVETALDEEG